MKKTLLKFLNPIAISKARTYSKKQRKYEKRKNDLELKLYGDILQSDMLHYGYFDDPETKPEDISISMVENAQKRYAELIVDKIPEGKTDVIDVGCGMGGLTKILRDKGYNTESLTPDRRQIEYISKKYPDFTVYKSKFEEFETEMQYDVIINSESFQYINLDDAFQQAEKLMKSGGRWIIVDYFRMTPNTKNKSGHEYTKYMAKLKEYGWEIEYEQNITPNIMPTLLYVNMYLDRIIKPIVLYGNEKLHTKKPAIYYLTEDLRESIDKKIDKEAAGVDPKIFEKDKKYIMYVLKKA